MLLIHARVLKLCFLQTLSPQSCGCCMSATPSLSSSSRQGAWPPPAPRGYWTCSPKRSTSGCPSWSAPPTMSTSTCPSSRSSRKAVKHRLSPTFIQKAQKSSEFYFDVYIVSSWDLRVMILWSQANIVLGPQHDELFNLNHRFKFYPTWDDLLRISIPRFHVLAAVIKCNWLFFMSSQMHFTKAWTDTFKEEIVDELAKFAHI